MTATRLQFIQAGDFRLRDAVVLGASTVNLARISTGLAVPAATYVGQRISISDGTNTDNYGLLDSTIPALGAGSTLEWVGIRIAPNARRAYPRNATVKFLPMATQIATVPDQTVKANERISLRLWDYYGMIGSAQRYLALRVSGATANIRSSQTQASSSVSPVFNITGVSPGVVTLTLTATDPAGSRLTQSFKVTVRQANRAPVITRALGNPTIRVGQIVGYDLDTYFSDPDGDALTYTVTDANPSSMLVWGMIGNELRFTAVGQHQTTLTVTATDGDLSVSQKMQVTVPANRPPQLTTHIPNQTLTSGAATPARITIADHFSDPDAQIAGWYFHWESGGLARQWERDVYHALNQVGSTQFEMQSLLRYPLAAPPPWGAMGTAWTVPAGTTVTLIDGSARLVTTLRAPADATYVNRLVRFDVVQVNDALPNIALSNDARVIFGDQDVAWPDPADTATGGLYLDLVEGTVDGIRPAYIVAYDDGGEATASNVFQVARGTPPTAVAIPDMTLLTGADVRIDLTQYFTSAAGHALTFTATAAPTSGTLAAHVSVHLDHAELGLHGVTAGDSTVTVIATDALGLSVVGTIAVTTADSAATAPSPGTAAVQLRNLIRLAGNVFDYTPPAST